MKYEKFKPFNIMMTELTFVADDGSWRQQFYDEAANLIGTVICLREVGVGSNFEDDVPEDLIIWCENHTERLYQQMLLGKIEQRLGGV